MYSKIWQGTVGLGVIIVLFSTLLVGTTVATELDDLVSIFNEISPAVGALYAQSSDGSLRFNCTVTAVGRDEQSVILITAFHCLTKDVAYMVSFDGRRFYSASAWKIPAEYIDPVKYRRQPGEPDVDMAFFRISEPVNVPIVLLSTTDMPPAPGVGIAVVGFPLGLTKVRYSGTIAGLFERPGADNNGYLILQSFGSPGNSGTAIVETKTRTIVGVLVSAQQAASGLPVIFATPIRYQKYLMQVPRRYE